jgi:hypothetical protein
MVLYKNVNEGYIGGLTFYLCMTHLCRVKNMLAMYLKYHKAGLTPTTPVTSTAISPIKMSIGYLPTIYTPILTDNPPILLTMDTSVAAKGKVGHVTSSAFRLFSGFIIYKY